MSLLDDLIAKAKAEKPTGGLLDDLIAKAKGTLATEAKPTWLPGEKPGFKTPRQLQAKANVERLVAESMGAGAPLPSLPESTAPELAIQAAQFIPGVFPAMALTEETNAVAEEMAGKQPEMVGEEAVFPRFPSDIPQRAVKRQVEGTIEGLSHPLEKPEEFIGTAGILASLLAGGLAGGLRGRLPKPVAAKARLRDLVGDAVVPEPVKLKGVEEPVSTAPITVEGPRMPQEARPAVEPTVTPTVPEIVESGPTGRPIEGLPRKRAPLGEGQKARSFPISVAESIAEPELLDLIKPEMAPGKRGAYTPSVRAEVSQEAKQLVNAGLDAAIDKMRAMPDDAMKTMVGIHALDGLQKAKRWDAAGDLAMEEAARLMKAGQSIDAVNILDRLSPETILRTAARRLNKAQQVLGKEMKLDPALARQLYELATRVKETTDPDLHFEAQLELAAALNSLDIPSTLRKVSTYQTVGQLLNPKTQIRNIAGNEIFYRTERLNKYIATPIDVFRSKLTGGPRTVTFRTGGQGGYWKGLMRGMSAGWKGVNPQGLASQVEFGKGLAFQGKGGVASKMASYMERTLRATMQGFDYAAFNRAWNQILGEMATLDSINRLGRVDKAHVKAFLETADPAIQQIADDYGRYVTFQDDTALSKSFVAVKRALNLGKEFGAGDLVLKYPKTPANLLARAIDYSPAGVVRSLFQIAGPHWFKKVPTAREITLGLSRGITGSLGLTAVGYLLRSSGILTGPQDEHRDVQGMERQTGTGPHRVNLSALRRWIHSGFQDVSLQPGDILISYDWAQPLAIPLAMGEASAQKTKEGASTVASALRGGVETLAEQPLISGLERAMKGGIVEGAAEMAEGAPATMIPTLLSQIQQLISNKAPLTYDPSATMGALKRAGAKIPGVAGKLPTRYNLIGESQERFAGDGNTLFNVLFNPAFVSKYEPGPEENLIMEEYRRTGDLKGMPNPPMPYIEREGVKQQLTAREYSRVQQRQGEILRDLIRENPGADMVQIVTMAGRMARDEIMEARGAQ